MIYLGAPNIQMYEPAPHSFINILDFNSVEEVVEYLKYLLLPENRNEYDKYLDWKTNLSNFEIKPNFLMAVENSAGNSLTNNSFICRLCQSVRNHLSFWSNSH